MIEMAMTHLANDIKISNNQKDRQLLQGIHQAVDELRVDVLKIIKASKSRIKPDIKNWRVKLNAIGKKIWVKSDGNSGREWEVTIDMKYGTAIYRLVKPTADDIKNGWVGTNKELIVREALNDDSYTYIRTEDLEARAVLLFDTVQWLLTNANKNLQEKDYQLGDTKQINDEIKKMKTAFLTKQKAWALKLGKMQDVSTRVAYFEQQYTKAKKEIEQALFDLTWLLSKHYPTFSQQEWSDIIKKEEANFKMSQGRPNIVNFDVVKDGKIQKRVRVMSGQFTCGEKTRPTTKRGVSQAIEDIVPNHVRDVTAVVDDNNKVKVLCSVIGHASYSNFEEKDRVKRRISNKKQVVTVIRDIIENMQNPIPDGKDKNNPITVSLTEMLLLTSKLGSLRESLAFHVIKKDKYQSEYRQLKDSCLAMERLRYSEQPIAVKMKDGSITYVKYDTSYMNMPVNAGESQLKVYNNPLQIGINARGFVDYNKQARKFVNDFKIDNNSSLSDEVKHFINLSKAYIDIESEQRKKQSLIFSIQLNEKFLKSSAKDLNDIEAKLQKKLDEKVPDEKEINSLKEQYRKKEKEFSAHLKNNFHLYRQLNELEKRNYMWKTKELTEVLHKQIEKVIATLPADAKDDSEQKKVRDLALFMQGHLVCEDMFYHEKYQDEHNTYKFQSHYLINNRAMGREILASCKSSEDRTGWQRVMLAAYVVFIELYGHAPQFDQTEDKRKFDTIIIQKIHEMSASLENTKYNSEARGLQISGRYTDQRIGVEIGKKSAKLAKGIFNHLGGYEPSAEVSETWEAFLSQAQSSEANDNVEKTAKTKDMSGIFHKMPAGFGTTFVNIKPNPLRLNTDVKDNKTPKSKDIGRIFHKPDAGFPTSVKVKPKPVRSNMESDKDHSKRQK